MSTTSDFEFSVCFLELDGDFSMSTKPTMSLDDELIYNGQIRPIKLSNYLQNSAGVGVVDRL